MQIIVTPSRLETAARCHRRHLLADQVGVMPQDWVGEAALSFGTVMHEAVGRFWQGVMLGRETATETEQAALDCLKATYAEELPALDGDARHTLDLAQFMLQHYFSAGRFAAENYANHLTWEPVVMEQRLEVELGEGIVLTFKLDRLGHEPASGMYVLVDTKTSGTRGRSFPSYWAGQWPRSLQQRLYRWATLKSFGMDPDSLENWIEGLLKNVPTEVKYVRLPNWTQGELDEAAELALKIGMENREYLKDGKMDVEKVLTSPNMNLGDCNAYYRDCPFTDLCHAPPEDRLGIFYADYREVPQNYLD